MTTKETKKENKNNLFIEIEYDILANDKLVQTTNEKNAKDAGLEIKEFGPKIILLNNGVFPMSIEKDIENNLKNTNKEIKLKLEAKEAYGLKNKKLIKVVSKSLFDEQKLRPLVGYTYRLDGQLCSVKSISGARITVDFNSPLAGKRINMTYKILNAEIKDIKKQTTTILEMLLGLEKEMYSIDVKEKDVTIKLPEILMQLKGDVLGLLKENIKDFANYSVKIEIFKK